MSGFRSLIDAPIAYTPVAFEGSREEEVTTNRIRHLVCGHTTIRIVDYGDDYRWVVECTECKQVEHWTQREWRSAQPESRTISGLLLVAQEPTEV